MSTEQDSTFDDPTETTPVDVAHQTTGIGMTSSSSRGAGYYFQCSVLLITVVGAAANGLVVYAMVASKQHRKHVLIFNQNALDLVNCLFSSVSFSLELSNIYLSGTSGYWLCLILLSNLVSWGILYGSLINLAAISIERYLKVVHHVWAKNKLRNWMIYSAMAFAWVAGIACSAALVIPTTSVVNGLCHSGIFFLSPTGRKAYLIWDFLSFYVTNLFLFTYCYGRILMVIRRQARVMAAHSGQTSNTAQDQSNKIQNSVIKTMILVSGMFSVTWGPSYIYPFLVDDNAALFHENAFFAVVFIAYLYVFINPFIYATKFTPVKRVLWGLITCKKNVPAAESGGTT